MVQHSRRKIVSEFSVGSISYAKLDSLLTLADAGSVTAAANSKKKQAGSISRHIKSLEEFFGCKLRQNAGKTVRLSPEGEDLVILLRRHMEELKNFRDERTNNLNSVSLAAGDSLLHLIVLPALSAIQAKYNRTTISVSAVRTFEIIQNLKNFSIDLGLLRLDSIRRRPGNSLSFEEIGEYRYAVFIPQVLWKDGMSDAEIFNLPFAIIKDHWDTDFVALAAEKGITFGNTRVLCGNFTHVFRLIRLKQYAGILPIFCRKLLPDTVCHEPAFLKEQNHKIVLAWNPSLAKTKTKLTEFIHTAVEQMRIIFQFGG